MSMLRALYDRFLAQERNRLATLLIVAFALRLIAILPYGNGISLPLRDQNTYYSLARAIVDDGYLGVPTIARGPYVELRNDRAPRPPGYYPAFHDSMAAVWDSTGYLYGMAKWGEPNSFFEPLYPLMSAGMFVLFGDNFFFWRMIHVLMGVLLVYLIYQIARRAFDDRVAAVAGFWAAFYPHFIFYAWVLMSEGLLLVLLALGFWAYFKLLDKPHWVWAALVGVFLGAFTLTRSFLVAFFPVMALCIGIFLKDRRRWRYAAVSALAFALTLAPWILRNYNLHHRIVLMSTRGGYNIWMRNNPYFIADELAAMGVKFSAEELDNLNYREYILGYPDFTADQGELERNEILTRQGMRFIRANPGFFAKMCWIRFKWTIGYKSAGLTGLKGPLISSVALLSYGPVLLGFVASLLLVWRRWNGRLSGRLKAALPMWLAVGYFVLFYSLTHEGLRYRVPVDPYMIILAAFSGVWIYDALRNRRQITSETPHA